MTDDGLIRWMRSVDSFAIEAGVLRRAADRMEALIAERDEARKAMMRHAIQHADRVADLKAARAERGEALAYEAKARIREIMADEARVSASLRASKAAAEVARLREVLSDARTGVERIAQMTDVECDFDGFSARDEARRTITRIDAALAEDKP